MKLMNLFMHEALHEAERRRIEDTTTTVESMVGEAQRIAYRPWNIASDICINDILLESED